MEVKKDSDRQRERGGAGRRKEDGCRQRGEDGCRQEGMQTEGKRDSAKKRDADSGKMDADRGKMDGKREGRWMQRRDKRGEKQKSKRQTRETPAPSV